ncbi:hypothetical protein PMAYCL1PPCAC_28807 [Pristionchus mayeri]|uniref:Uncharacterized protein n=1 Tax=Pristionchus mayeri TaxID=1317129 RepID=A0AAN5DAG5_9BILA|nr:hypothetical protein PMAYCL1PPCAC_28805 [Pristionchus mayeri]GMR58612.1 hypothetical protein PMAYCL1PPCAC_28807 [Pristionchus mayeri]
MFATKRYFSPITGLVFGFNPVGEDGSFVRVCVILNDGRSVLVDIGMTTWKEKNFDEKAKVGQLLEVDVNVAHQHSSFEEQNAYYMCDVITTPILRMNSTFSFIRTCKPNASLIYNCIAVLEAFKLHERKPIKKAPSTSVLECRMSEREVVYLRGIDHFLDTIKNVLTPGTVSNCRIVVCTPRQLNSIF